MRSVYELDKRSAELCRDMQIVGMRFDRKRAENMRGFLLDKEQAKRSEIESALGRKIETTKTGGFKQKDLVSAYQELGAPIVKRSAITQRPSYDVEVLRSYALSANDDLRVFAEEMLEWRRLRKVRSTYVEGMIKRERYGRIHPSWLNYGAISGRWSCRKPNLMTLPRPENDPTFEEFPGGIRSLMIASRGCRFVIFDAKQLEMRIAAYASGDEAMIEACESSDLHAANALIIFGEAFAQATGGKRKALRTMAKTAAFAVCYMAEAETVFDRLIADGQKVNMRAVRAMLNKLHRSFRGYYRWQDRKLLDCARTGYVYTPITGRRRYLGHDPSPTECANFPIQGGAADLVNIRANEIVAELAAHNLRTSLVAQVHDSLVLDTKKSDVPEVSDRCRETFEQPIRIASSGKAYDPSFPIDLDVSERLAA